MRSAVLALGSLALLLVATPAAAAEPETGWYELRTAHVVLRTDLGIKDARRAVIAVERTRTAMLSTAWGGAKLAQPERIEVVVFANGLDFEHFFGRSVGGLFTHGDYPPLAILYGAPDRWERRETLATEETTSVLKHELAHHLASYFYRRQPRWFAEGLAQFLETIRVSDDGKTAVMGAVNLEALKRYNSFRTLTVADALAWGGKLDAKDEGTTLGYYGLSWLLVHWLYNTHATELAKFETLLAKGIDPDKAWKIVFGSLDLGAVDRELNQYSKHGGYQEFIGTLSASDADLREQPLGIADVHATRARVALTAGRSRQDGAAFLEEGRKELAAALLAEPGNVRAIRLLSALVPASERLALARRATTAHPEDGLAWLTLGEALPDRTEDLTERERAYRKATELLSDHPLAFHNLAWIYVRENRAREALPLALVAVQLSPWNPIFLDTLAAALAGVGRCTEAVASEERALEALAERGNSAARSTFVQRRDDYQQRCQPATPAP